VLAGWYARLVSTPDDILRFWFGAAPDEATVLAAGGARWFARDAAFDREIGARFGATWADAKDGRLDPWADSGQGGLALLLLLDQFSRNLHRDSPVAYAADAHAQRVCLEGLRRGHDRALTRPQRVFFYLPLEHAENLALQHCSVALFAALRDEAPAELRSPYDGFLHYARAHRDVIAAHGRFPHRNAVLGRASTDAELAYLAQPGAGF
jgi:uncharacterized protein (DUF924 family)